MSIDKLKLSKLDPEAHRLITTMTRTVITNQLSSVAKSLFVWDGLPEEVKSEYIELALYIQGQACFFKHKNLGFLALKCGGNYGQNVYGYPVAYQAFGIGLTERVNASDGVWIRNNINLLPSANIVYLYAEKIVDILRTADINVNAQKMPWILAGDEKTKLSLKTLLNDVMDFKPAFLVDKSLDLKGITVLQTNAPFVVAELMDYKRELLNDFLTMYGVNNAAVDKKERLITDEVNSNNEFIDLCGDTFLSMRKQAAEEINKMFDLNVTVNINPNILKENTEPEEQTEEPTEGGGENE